MKDVRLKDILDDMAEETAAKPDAEKAKSPIKVFQANPLMTPEEAAKAEIKVVSLFNNNVESKETCAGCGKVVVPGIPVWAFANDDLGKPLCEDCIDGLSGSMAMEEIEKATAPKPVIVYSSMEWNAPGKPLVFDIEALDECAETFHDDFIDELKHLKECIEQYINRRRSMTNVRRAEYELETLLKQNGHSDEMPF